MSYKVGPVFSLRHLPFLATKQHKQYNPMNIIFEQVEPKLPTCIPGNIFKCRHVLYSCRVIITANTSSVLLNRYTHFEFTVFAHIKETMSKTHILTFILKHLNGNQVPGAKFSSKIVF